MTPEQPKIVRLVDTAILSKIPEADPDLPTHLSQLLRTNKPEHQNKTFWFPTPGKPSKVEDHTPIQMKILKELRELHEK